MTCIGFVFRNVDVSAGGIVYRYQPGLAPSYHTDELQRLVDNESRQWLRSASTTALDNWPLLLPHSSVEQPSTAGDVIAIVDNLSVTFEE